MDDFVLQQVKQLFSVLNVSTALLLWLTFGSCKFTTLRVLETCHCGAEPRIIVHNSSGNSRVV